VVAPAIDETLGELNRLVRYSRSVQGLSSHRSNIGILT
jgi:hypothetical protein